VDEIDDRLIPRTWVLPEGSVAAGNERPCANASTQGIEQSAGQLRPDDDVVACGEHQRRYSHRADPLRAVVCGERRQLTVMFGALIFDVVLLIIGALLLFHVAGYNFVYAVNAGPKAYAIPSGPFYSFLAALSVNVPVITVIILGCFLFWALPSMIANTFMPIRSFFAWSFDRLMPEKLADVNERTHSPVTAILVVNAIIAAPTIWSVYSNVFQLVLGLIVLAGCLGVVIVAAAAIALPIRRPDLYRASPANVKFLGVPVLWIVATLSIIIFVTLAVVSTQYPALVMNGNTANFWWIPAWFGGLIVAGALLCYIPRFIRARRGINVSFVYKELPPE
jgi:amino acid transporter